MQMAKQQPRTKEFVKHEHKIMIILGLLIVLFTYDSTSHLGVIFGSLIIGVGLARIKD